MELGFSGHGCLRSWRAFQVMGVFVLGELFRSWVSSFLGRRPGLNHQDRRRAIRPNLPQRAALRQHPIPRARLDRPSYPENNPKSAAQGGSALSEISETGQYHAPLPSPAPSKTAKGQFHPCSPPRKTQERALAANPGSGCLGCFSLRCS